MLAVFGALAVSGVLVVFEGPAVSGCPTRNVKFVVKCEEMRPFQFAFITLNDSASV